MDLGLQTPILAPKLARIGARVGLRETPQHQSVLIHSGWGPGGRIDAAGPAVSATIDEISSFDLENEILGFGETHVVPKPNR